MFSAGVAAPGWDFIQYGGRAINDYRQMVNWQICKRVLISLLDVSQLFTQLTQAAASSASAAPESAPVGKRKPTAVAHPSEPLDSAASSSSDASYAFSHEPAGAAGAGDELAAADSSSSAPPLKKQPKKREPKPKPAAVAAVAAAALSFDRELDDCSSELEPLSPRDRDECCAPCGDELMSPDRASCKTSNSFR